MTTQLQNDRFTEIYQHCDSIKKLELEMYLFWFFFLLDKIGRRISNRAGVDARRPILYHVMCFAQYEGARVL